MAKTYALVGASGNIVNRIVLDDAATFTPEKGLSIVAQITEDGACGAAGVGSFEIGGTFVNGIYTAPPEPAPLMAPPPPSILSQDLMAQFTPTDDALIKFAIADELTAARAVFDGGGTPSTPLGLLWSSLQAQQDPMVVTNARFQAGWGALQQVLGETRMAEMAAALDVTI